MNDPTSNNIKLSIITASVLINSFFIDLFLRPFTMKIPWVILAEYAINSNQKNGVSAVNR